MWLQFSIDLVHALPMIDRNSIELNLFIQFPFEMRLIPPGHRMRKKWKKSLQVFWSSSQIFFFLSFWFLFNYGKLFVVYFSNDEFNWRIKYLMIYLTKQIVQLPLGFCVFLFRFVLYTQTSFPCSFVRVHADILLQIVRWSGRESTRKKMSVLIIIFRGNIKLSRKAVCVDLMKYILITLCICELVFWCWTLLEWVSLPPFFFNNFLIFLCIQEVKVWIMFAVTVTAVCSYLLTSL